jgi:hypothetical protein
MEVSPSWEAASHSATQEFPNILQNLKVHFHVHKSPSKAPILSQINPVHTTPSCLSEIKFILSSRLLLHLPSGFFLSDFSTKILYVFIFSFMRATCASWFHMFSKVLFWSQVDAVYSGLHIYKLINERELKTRIPRQPHGLIPEKRRKAKAWWKSVG